MDNYQQYQLPERNPVTHLKHRREVLRQITIPLIAGVVVALVLASLIVFRTGADQTSRWADISIIWLIIPVFFMSLIFLIVLAGVIYGIVQLVLVLPVYFRQAQDFMILFSVQVGKVGDKAVEPVLRVQAFTASIRVLLQKARRQ